MFKMPGAPVGSDLDAWLIDIIIYVMHGLWVGHAPGGLDSALQVQPLTT